VKTGDLEDGPVFDVPDTLTDEGVANSSAKILPEGTLLVAMYGATIGKLGVLTVPSATNQACAALLPDPWISDTLQYVFYYLMSVRRALRDSGKGGAQPNISQTVIKSFPIVIAPLPEQHRIVEAIESYLTRLDDAVSTLERVQQNLKRYRASVLKAAVEGRLVPTEAELAREEGRDHEPANVLLERILVERRKCWIEDAAEKGRAKAEEKARKAGKPWTKKKDATTLEAERAKAVKKYKEPAVPATTDLPELPEGWCWTTVDQVSLGVKYGSSAKTKVDSGGAVPVLRMGNIVEGQLDFSDLKFLPGEHHEFPDLLLEEGDLLFNRTNSAELVGKTAVFRGQMKPCSFASYLIRVRFSRGVEAEYVTHFINSVAGRRWIGSVVSQQVGQANVNGTKLRSCAVPLPPSAEQQRIRAEVGRLHSVAFAAEEDARRDFSRCHQLHQAILKWAFEGKLVDQDPKDEPASVLLERIKAEREAMTPTKKTNRRVSRRKKVK
jgi:type I restriction enzyme S subunit